MWMGRAERVCPGNLIHGMASMDHFVRRPKVTEVFEPRRPNINEKIYVPRPDLETALERAIRGSQYPWLFGESGSGKSWLYKKVLTRMDALVCFANSANVARHNSLVKEIRRLGVDAGKASLKEYSKTKKADVGIPAVGSGGFAHENKYQVEAEEDLLMAYRLLRAKAGDRPAVIVLDNLEFLFEKPALMEELGGIITLVDDPTYASHKIQLLLVGTSSQLIRYFSKTSNLATVANRINELPEVAGFNELQVNQLVSKGFLDLLRLSIDENLFVKWQKHIFNVTLGIPQYVHEFCLQLAYVLEENQWSALPWHLISANAAWVKSGHRESYTCISALMNQRHTKTQRRDQVLYALGSIQGRTFAAPEVEELVRKLFPRSTEGVGLGINQILAELSGAENSIIKRCPGMTEYEFKHPRHLMCLRLMLKKHDGEEKVTKIKC